MPLPYLLFLLIGVGVDAIRVIKYTVIVHGGACRGSQLEDLSAAGSSNDSISGGYSRNDSLHHTLR